MSRTRLFEWHRRSRTRLFEWHRRFKEGREEMVTGVGGHPQAEQKKMFNV